MDIQYEIRECPDVTGKYYEITTHNGSVDEPQRSIEALRSHLMGKYGIKDNEFERITKDLQEMGGAVFKATHWC